MVRKNYRALKALKKGLINVWLAKHITFGLPNQPLNFVKPKKKRLMAMERRIRQRGLGLQFPLFSSMILS